MENNTLTKVWLVGSGESDENLCLDDVSVYLTEAEAREAADNLAAYLGETFVFVQCRNLA
jgi:hypothetical protein